MMLALQNRAVLQTSVPRPGRRTAAVLAVVVGALALLPSAWGYLSDPRRFAIEEVSVRGELRHVEPEALREAVVGAIDGGFFGLDVERVREAVQRLPWVDQVWVRRVWPDALEVRVQEQVPLAAWSDDRLVNVRGELFEAPGQLPADLPRLRGAEDRAADVAAMYAAVTRRVSRLGLEVSALSLDEREAMRIALAGGFELVIGRKDRQQRLNRFVRVYPKLLAPRAGDIVRIDLRYGNGFAVQWKDGRQSQTS